MNKQKKPSLFCSDAGFVRQDKSIGWYVHLDGGIEWTATLVYPGDRYDIPPVGGIHAEKPIDVIPGYTWNPVAGCMHNCRWHMPEGNIAKCYAETTAEGVAKKSYPQGFAHHYFRQNMLHHPRGVRGPAKIFLDSMSDLLGNWVHEDEIEKVFAVVAQRPDLQFQLLTKNPTRLNILADSVWFPENLWIGFSTPPEEFNHHHMDERRKNAYMRAALKAIGRRQQDNLVWLSAEPLSWDVVQVLADFPPLDWIVIGAASDESRYYQPDPKHLASLLTYAAEYDIPVFFKGNLSQQPPRADFPNYRRFDPGS